MAASSFFRAYVSPSYVLVDIDNIAFCDGQLNEECLRRRIKSISAVYPMSTEYFCNPATFAFLKRIAFKPLTKVRPSGDNSKDSADLLLLRRYKQLRQEKGVDAVIVITHDKTLARLVRYFGPWPGSGKSCLHTFCGGGRSVQTLHFGMFASSESSSLVIHPPERFNLSFNDRSDIDSFMQKCTVT